MKVKSLSVAMFLATSLLWATVSQANWFSSAENTNKAKALPVQQATSTSPHNTTGGAFNDHQKTQIEKIVH